MSDPKLDGALVRALGRTMERIKTRNYKRRLSAVDYAMIVGVLAREMEVRLSAKDMGEVIERLDRIE